MSSPFDQPFDAAPTPDPSLEQFNADFGLSGEAKPKDLPAGFREWDGKLITQPGAYRDVPIDRYHGREICDAPSISSTGLKLLTGEKGQRTKGKTPRHFYEQSSLNPKRRPQKQTDALRLGSGFHDALLLPKAWRSDYHFLPEGFSRAAKVKQAAEIAEADDAIASGKCVMGVDEVIRIEAMAKAVREDPLIATLIRTGEPEVTLAWKDKETGVWCRSRPDWMTAKRRFGMNFKTDVDASWDGFSKSITKYGYHVSAAMEMAGYEAVFGEMPSAYFHPCVEKPGKDFEDGDYIATALWQLPEQDLERGRFLMRAALRTFADCLASGKWDGYTPQPDMCGLTGWARKVLDEGGQGDAADDQVDNSEDEA